MTEKIINQKFRTIQNSFIKLNACQSNETIQFKKKRNCKAILFFPYFTSSLFAKGNLKASFILFVVCSFLNITDLSMRMCLSSGERSSKVWSS